MTKFEDNDTWFGTFYPRGYVVAVVHQPEDAAQAIVALDQAGFEEVRMWTGQQVLDRHNEFMSTRSTLQKLGGMIASDEGLALDDYLEAAGENHTFLTIHVRDHAHADAARDILTQHHAHLIRYYGDVGMTDLTP